MMSTAEIWLTIIGLTLVTIFTRNFFLALGDALRLPERVHHALRYAPACALVALLAPELVLQQGALALQLSNPKLMGALAATLILLWRRNVLLTIATGMAVFTLLRWWA